MMNISRTLKEWQTIFDLEPTIREIFLEGETDRRLVEAFLRAIGINDAGVRTASEIDFGQQNFSGDPFCSGNKLRLVSFASTLTNSFKCNIRGLICIIDKDADALLPLAHYPYCIMRTDYANLPAFFIEHSFIGFYTHTIYGKSISAPFFDSIMEAARFSFALRVYRYGQRPSPAKVALEPSQFKHKSIVAFDKEDLIRRYSIKNNIFKNKDLVFSEVENIFARMNDDPRHYVNSHDFFDLLYNGLKILGVVKGAVGIEDVKRNFTASISLDRINTVPLMNEIRNWVSVA